MTSCELFGHSYHNVTGHCGYCDRVLPMPVKSAAALTPAPAPALPPVIKLSYSTIDRYYESRRFKTLAGARAYAKRKLGASFDLGGSYAVSFDGVAKLTANIPLALLLGA